MVWSEKHYYILQHLMHVPVQYTHDSIIQSQWQLTTHCKEESSYRRNSQPFVDGKMLHLDMHICPIVWLIPWGKEMQWVEGGDPVIDVICPSQGTHSCMLHNHIAVKGSGVMQIAGQGSLHAGKSIPPEGNPSRSAAHYWSPTFPIHFPYLYITLGHFNESLLSFHHIVSSSNGFLSTEII